VLPLNIAICEDTPTDAHILRDLTAKSGVSASVFVYGTTAEFISAFQPGFFQLAFMDIYFDSTSDGLDAAVKIREADPDIWIVFTTSSPVHAKFGYKVKADRYLDKPLDEEEVLSLLERAVKHFSDTSAEIVITVDYKKHRIKQRDILYVEIFDKKSMIHLKDETIETYMKIGDMEKLLTLPSFIRCHRCYIVNMDHIESETDDELDFIMKNGDRVYIGQNIRRRVKRTYREFVILLARGKLA
jgi:DNA-binding LytR/AlgR family response regulator